MFLHSLKCFSEESPFAKHNLPAAEMHPVTPIVDDDIKSGVNNDQAIYVSDDSDFEHPTSKPPVSRNFHLARPTKK